LAITAAEQSRRREAVDFACASIGLEGFTITKEHEARAERYVLGEIDLQEFIAGSSDVTPSV
jgi:hypothetical protein